MSWKFNPFTGNLDIDSSVDSGASQSNFSYLYIENGKEVEIKNGQQMILDGHLRVDGHLLVSGEISRLTKNLGELYFYTKIIQDEVILINKNRLLLYKGHLQIDGHIRVIGHIAGV